MKDNMLFLGNGLNRLSKGQSWGDILDQIAGDTTTQLDRDIRSKKPFTLLFDEIISNQSERVVKERIAKELGDDSLENAYHKKFGSLPIKDIITTNYDYNIEAALGGDKVTSNGAPETIYSLFRRTVVQDKNVWHIHGEADSPGSIMLGHSQYNGYLHKIMSLLRGGVPTQSKLRNHRSFLSLYARENIDRDLYVSNWIDRFFESDVHMVGFGFDYTENHLWYLIQEKRRLKNKGSKNGVGETFFYDCSKCDDNDHMKVAEAARQSLLESFGVKVKRFRAEAYDESYDMCHQYLRSKLQS